MSATVLASRIEAVTVFNRGAMVTRVAELDASNGEQVRVGGIPLAADDTSVRAQFEADADGPAFGVTDVRVALEAPEAERTLPPNQRELDEAREAEERVRAEVAQVERELTRLQSVAVPPRPRTRDARVP